MYRETPGSSHLKKCHQYSVAMGLGGGDHYRQDAAVQQELDKGLGIASSDILLYLMQVRLVLNGNFPHIGNPNPSFLQVWTVEKQVLDRT